MFVLVNEEKHKGMIMGYIGSYNESTSKSGNAMLNVKIIDGEQDYWITFLDKTDSKFGEQLRATNAKRFLTSNYFKTPEGRVSPVGHPVAIKVSVTEGEYNGETRTSYFGDKLLNPKGTVDFRSPDRTILFGYLVGKNTNGENKGSICCKVNNNGTWSDNWFQGKITDEQVNDLQKVNGKCPLGIAWIEGDEFKYKKLTSEPPVPGESTPTSTTTPTSSTDATTSDTSVSSQLSETSDNSIHSESLEDEIEFDDLEFDDFD